MKKQFIIYAILLAGASKSLAFAQKNSKNILNNNNIQDIEQYLLNAHPQDPKRNILKSKLVTLKNEQWTKGKETAVPMQARPVTSENNFPKNIDETKEFNQLISLTPQSHKEKTVKLLNTIFNEDISSMDAILLFKNQSDCNIIIRIQGKQNYNMPVSANAENFIIISKGTYNLTSNICESQYSSKKNIQKGTIVTIKNKEFNKG